jgi:hypothetical protein
MSIGQREVIQKLLNSLPLTDAQLPLPDMRRARTGINKAYTNLLSRGNITR